MVRPRNTTAVAEATTESLGPFYQHVRVILLGGVELDLDSVCDELEIVRCGEITLLPKLLSGNVPAVLLVDLVLLSPNGKLQILTTVGRLNVPAIAFSNECDDLDMEGLLRAGFAGALPRNGPVGHVVNAVRAVVLGQMWFSRAVISNVLRALLFEKNLSRFTSREIEILTLIGSGLNNQQIADKLFITRETVRWHVRGLYSKLGIEGRRDARGYLQELYGSSKRIRAKSEIDKAASSRVSA